MNKNHTQGKRWKSRFLSFLILCPELESIAVVMYKMPSPKPHWNAKCILRLVEVGRSRFSFAAVVAVVVVARQWVLCAHDTSGKRTKKKSESGAHVRSGQNHTLWHHDKMRENEGQWITSHHSCSSMRPWASCIQAGIRWKPDGISQYFTSV